jgi:hypothetical protein
MSISEEFCNVSQNQWPLGRTDEGHGVFAADILCILHRGDKEGSGVCQWPPFGGKQCFKKARAAYRKGE